MLITVTLLNEKERNKKKNTKRNAKSKQFVPEFGWLVRWKWCGGGLCSQRNSRKNSIPSTINMARVERNEKIFTAAYHINEMQ